MAYPHVGTILKGHVVVAVYNNQVVLCHALNPNRPEPYVVWSLTSGADGGDPYNGAYCSQQETAEQKFVERCFPRWFHPVKTPELSNLKEYDDHGTAEYHGWLLAWRNDGESDILCFAPNDDFDGADFDDFDELCSLYTAEWEASIVNEAIEFIDNY